MPVKIFPEFAHLVATDKYLKERFGGALNRSHFYDLTECDFEIGRKSDPDLMFLPSSVTVMETFMNGPNNKHCIFLAENVVDGIVIHLLLEDDERGSGIGLGPVFKLAVNGSGGYSWETYTGWGPNEHLNNDTIGDYAGFFFGLLDIINRPHTRLTRRVWKDAQKKKVKGHRGAFFSGYTEVVIEDRTVRTGGSGTTDIHKRLHYVRSHLRRYRSGRSVQVPEHWRGDPKLGVTDHRYRVKPPNDPKPKDKIQ